MRTIHHLSVSINGLLANFKRKKITFMIDDNGKEMSDKQAREELARLQYLGHKLIKTCECEGFDPFENGCPGHEIQDED